MASIYACLTASVEAATPSSTAKKLLGLRNRSSYFVVAKLSALFTLDAFAGGELSHMCARTGRAPAAFALGLGSPLPTSAPALGSPLPASVLRLGSLLRHLHQGLARKRSSSCGFRGAGSRTRRCWESR